MHEFQSRSSMELKIGIEILVDQLTESEVQDSDQAIFKFRI